MNSIDIHLEIFEGPLDLLMYLIKKNNLDIYDIPISQITREYLSYLDVMKELNLEIAGEFLVMASTLMQIKARMLLPKQPDENEEEGKDPREKLVSMLEDYQKYKTASKILEERFNKFKDVFYRGSPVFSNEDKFLDVEFMALIDAVKRAFEKLPDKKEIQGEDFPIETRIEKVLNFFKEREWILLDEVFKDETRKLGVITCFLAMLELIKQGKIIVAQDEPLSEVRVYLRKEPGESTTDQG
ncbi:MAG: segregation/condensation protein A [Elusimicrobia bacterium CG08_land_8_20_14_0_20_51_18]|nr:MAG: segregation/condensation protein A [Elusimicrobia bacterium CG08_land_8_20_14_0_20_51_18]